ncbi:MAG: Ribonuclease VapC [Chloroflexi bacterium]|nr:Ribonuclease VapC [Chloroflexota bacterium]
MATKPKIVFWKPGGVVRGKQVYLDANFLVGLAQPGHIWNSSACGILASLSERGTKLVLSALALNEAIYQLDRLEQKNRARPGDTGSNEPPSLETGWAARLEQALESLSNLVFFEPPDLDFHRQVIRAVGELNLDPTDAFHYTAARRLACPILSNDVGFQKIPDQNLVVVTFF